VSAHALDEVAQAAEPLQLDGFLTKPVNASLLYNRLAGLLHEGAGPAHALPGPQPVAADLRPVHGARILLVEDYPLNQEVALGLLADARVWVDLAENGREAVERVQTKAYDLVLMDIQMPVLDGLSATREIRALPGFARLPIIAMTAHAMAGDRQVSLDAGMNDHVVKPIDPAQLYQTLLRWIDPATLQGREVPGAPEGMAEGIDSEALLRELPLLPQVNWRVALQRVNHNVGMLQRLLRNFRNDYGDAATRIAAAAAGGNDEDVRILAHNLKASAAYLGASGLSAQAAALEQALRQLRPDEARRLLPPLMADLDALLAGLAGVLLGPQASDGGSTDPAVLTPLMQGLATLLTENNSRAEDRFAALQAALGSHHGSELEAIRAAIDDIEYEQALAGLQALALHLHIPLEPAP